MRDKKRDKFVTQGGKIYYRYMFSPYKSCVVTNTNQERVSEEWKVLAVSYFLSVTRTPYRLRHCFRRKGRTTDRQCLKHIRSLVMIVRLNC